MYGDKMKYSVGTWIVEINDKNIITYSVSSGQGLFKGMVTTSKAGKIGTKFERSALVPKYVKESIIKKLK